MQMQLYNQPLFFFSLKDFKVLLFMLTNLGLFLATTDLQKYTAVFVLLLFCVYILGKLFIFQIF